MSYIDLVFKHLKKEHGSAYIELAITLPLLLFILFAIFEVGFVISYDNALISVVDYGIRAIAINGCMDNDIKGKIDEQLELKGMDPAKAEINATLTPVNYRDNVFLEIKYPYEFSILGFKQLHYYQFMLEAKSYAICEKYTR